ncbi:MAG: TIGR01906 family membrane protein [Anaerolineales bacterium]
MTQLNSKHSLNETQNEENHTEVDGPDTVHLPEPNQRRWFSKTLSWVASILVPVVLILTGVRLLLTPAFLQIEYRTPGFPPDPFGFSLEERLYWSNIALDYLLNEEDISFLADLRFSNGLPVYNQRELAHMVDVKIVVTDALNVWLASLGGLLVLGVWAWLGHWIPEYKRGLVRGGWLTLFLIGAIVILVLMAFGVFFVLFHEIFFPPGTWTFSYSDTLIRLFPERFWRDAFLMVGTFSIVGSILFVVLFKKRTV